MGFDRSTAVTTIIGSALPFLVAASAIVGSAATLTAQATPPEAPARFADARDLILRVMRERDLPSVAVAVAKDGEVLWEAAFGWADRERRVPATPHTLYSLASISKPIAATALMTLVEDGAVSLDVPANGHLGAAKITDPGGLAARAEPAGTVSAPRTASVRRVAVGSQRSSGPSIASARPAPAATVRRVLSHTAGLPLHYRFFFDDDPHPVASHDEAIARYGVLVNPPGEVYEYSNLGYGVVGRMVEIESGDALAGYVRREVYSPLGMTRSSVHLPPELEPYAARRYDGDRAPIPYYRFDHDGASAMWSSAHDMIRFALFHLGHTPEGATPVLADSTRGLMQRAVEPASYGLGWFIDQDDHGLRCVWHSGSMPGVSTMLRMYPEEDLAVVVLLNTLDRPMRLRIAQELAAAVVPAYEERLRAALAERDRAADRGDEARPAFEPPAELHGEWTGTLRTYEREVPLRLVVQDDGDVHVDLDGQLETLLDRARWDDGRLSGVFAGRIPTDDAARHDHIVGLELTLRGGRLAGRATALSNENGRAYYALSSWVELTRAVAVR